MGHFDDIRGAEYPPARVASSAERYGERIELRTNASLPTDAEGRVTLRGFCGDYRVRLLPKTDRGQERGVGFKVPQACHGKFKLSLAIGE